MKPYLVISVEDVRQLDISAGDVAIVLAADEEEAARRFCYEVAPTYPNVEAEITNTEIEPHFFTFLEEAPSDEDRALDFMREKVNEFFAPHTDYADIYMRWVESIWETHRLPEGMEPVRFPPDMIGFILHSGTWTRITVLDISAMKVRTDDMTPFAQVLRDSLAGKNAPKRKGLG
jgi:hypothetical protein